MNLSPSIALLLHLRDWPRPQRPFNNCIVLIALRDAGEAGLRAGQLSTILGKHASTDAATYLANLETKGLVNRHLAQAHRSTCYWTLSDSGKRHVAGLFTLPAASEVPA
jgi:DNA-binding MarR family transcriptional regulator